MRSWLSKHREWFWVPILYTAVVMVLYREVWWGIDGKLRWFGWDCLEYYWPDIAYWAGNLREGEFALWNPYERGGYPFHADMHVGTYSPFGWTFAGLGALWGGTPGWIVQAKAMSHLVIMGAMSHAFLRTRKLHAFAAVVGAVSWIVAVPMIVHKASALNWTFAWAPLIFIATDWAIANARLRSWWRASVFLAAALWLAGSSAPPQGFFFALLIAFAYGGLRTGQFFYEGGRENLKKNMLAMAKLLAVAAVITVGLLLVLMIPAGETVALSFRGQRSAAYPFNIALPMMETLRGYITPAAGKVDAYCGVVVLGLALFALFRAPRRDKWAPLLFMLCAMVFADLTFGAKSHLLPFLVNHVPGFELFREPNRYKCIVALCLALSAAYGVDILIRDQAGRRRSIITLLAIFAGLALGALLMKLDGVKSISGFTAGYGTTFAVLLAGALSGLALLFLRRSQWVFAAMLVTTIYMDGARFGNGFVTRPTEKPVDDQEDRKHLAGLENLETDWRVYDEFLMEQRPGSRLRIRNFRGYPSGAPFGDRRHRILLKDYLPKHPELLEVFNVRYVFHGRHGRNGMRSNYIKRRPDQISPKHFKRIDGKRFESLHPAPLIMWYGDISLSDSAKETLEILMRNEGPDGVRRDVVIERPDIKGIDLIGVDTPQVPSAMSPVEGKLISFKPDRVEFEVSAPENGGVVVLNEKFWKGWQVSVDGESAEGFRANYILRGVQIPAGTHRVVWEFHPEGHRFLFTLYFLCLLLILLAIFYPRLDRLRHRLQKRRASGQETKS
ncbi:MAG: hypothetical protein JKY56_12700 [Kofleriaceae bacterium]|nr:hypothetical protein [Kofleriaceae bacterium]